MFVLLATAGCRPESTAAEIAGKDSAATTGDSAAESEPPLQFPFATPEWPDCGLLVDPADLFDGNEALRFYGETRTPVIALVAGYDYAESGVGTGSCPESTTVDDTWTLTGDCTASTGATFAGTLRTWMPSGLDSWWMEADGFRFDWPDHEYAFAADGIWSYDLSQDSAAFTNDGSYGIVDSSPDCRGARTDQSSSACVAGVCADSGHVTFSAFRDDGDAYEGEVCFSAVSSGATLPFDGGGGVIRIIGLQRVELRIDPAAPEAWAQIDGGEWVEL